MQIYDTFEMLSAVENEARSFHRGAARNLAEKELELGQISYLSSCMSTI